METITVTDASAVTSSESVTIDGSPHVVHVSIPNQPVQVQSVLQAASPSLLQQAAGGSIQTIQVTPVVGDDTDEDAEKKRREILARRPSYRRILNELSSDPPIGTTPKIEEESNSSQTSQDSTETSTTTTVATVQYPQAAAGVVKVVPAQTIQLTSGDGVTAAGLQTLTMTNAQQSAGAGATIVQYAQGPDGQFFIPVSNISAGSVQAYQITTPATTTLPQGVVMATAGTTLSPSQAQLSEEHSRKRELRLLKNSPAEEQSLKRELRLLKNKEAARECRRKKKDYVKCLENRVAVLENQNKALIEELKSLKELYCQKEHVEG